MSIHKIIINIKTNISLKPYNTFGIDVQAKRFVSVNSIIEIKEILNLKEDLFLIGGGSNMLLLNDIERLVVHINTKGKEILKKDKTHIWVKVAGGENWHDFVTWCVENDYGGIENLANIPGNVGTSPIQNIGAYGVEVKNVIESVHAINIESGNKKTFSNQDCQFGYRDSIFKRALKGVYLITDVTFRLTLAKHQIKADYGAIQSKLKNNQIKIPTIKNVKNAIIEIREEKLPDPKKIGNSGSFFKNPIIKKDVFLTLQIKYPMIPNYPVKTNTEVVKLAAGWLIDQCGFKGKRIGDAGVHKNQALVLVNYGKATGVGILALAQIIQDKVHDKFGIILEIEVNIIK